jgi:hypothetical protein
MVKWNCHRLKYLVLYYKRVIALILRNIVPCSISYCPRKLVHGIWFLFHRIWFLCCVITCSDFYPFSNQIIIIMVINIWGIIITFVMLILTFVMLILTFNMFARVIVLWQGNVRGTRNVSLVADVVFKCLRQRSNWLKICLPAVFYIYVFST